MAVQFEQDKTTEVYAVILNRRKEIWDRVERSPELQQLTLEMCRRDRAYWTNNWVYGFDPRNLPARPAIVPIVLFPKQEEFLNWLHDRRLKKENGLVEKCRDSGATYLCCIYAVHGWLFENGFKATFGSRKEDLVDKSDDPDSIFEKIRGIIRYLPKWMLPSLFDSNKHDKFLRIKNPNNESVITGEAGDNMGRGGRATIYFKDEAAFLAHPEKIEAAVSGNSDVVIDISTPQGLGTPFARKRHSGAIPVFTFKWTDDPRKNRRWYLKKKKTLDPLVFAQEVEIDYTGSIENVLIPAEWVNAAKKLILPKEYLERNKNTKRVAGLDIADSGHNKNVFLIRRGICAEFVVSWQGTNTTETAYRAIEIGNRQKIDLLNYDRLGVGAGVAGILESQEYDEYCETPEIKAKQAKFIFEGFKAGDKCSDRTWDAFGDRSSSQIFVNLKAEACWLLRTRFEKTFEYVEKGIEHPIDELIYLPEEQLKQSSNLQSLLFNLRDESGLYDDASESNDVDLLFSQISQPRFFYSDRGLIRMEKKSEMKSRGINSPDFFDTLLMAFLEDEAFDPIEAMNAEW